tara:strand:- start:237 stop:812 length:576 start_codon:yes stop_codon:yes gene_type:complete
MNTNIQVSVGGNAAVVNNAQKAGLFCAEVNRKMLDFSSQELCGLELKLQKKLKVTIEENEIIGESKLGYVLHVIDGGLDISFPDETFATVNFEGPMVLEISQEQVIVSIDAIDQDKTETFIKATLSSKPGNAAGKINSIVIEGEETYLPKVKECREVVLFLTVPQHLHSTQAAYGGIKATERKYFEFNESV